MPVVRLMTRLGIVRRKGTLLAATAALLLSVVTPVVAAQSATAVGPPVKPLSAGSLHPVPDLGSPPPLSAAISSAMNSFGLKVASLRAAGVTVSGYGPTSAGDRLQVSVAGSVTPQVVAAIQRATGDQNVRVYQQAMFHESGSKNDFPPWFGGDEITGSTEGCVSGFTVLNPFGVARALTASHCGVGPWNSAGQFFGNTVLRPFPHGGPGAVDAQTIGDSPVNNYLSSFWVSPTTTDTVFATGNAINFPINICISAGDSQTYRCGGIAVSFNQCEEFLSSTGEIDEYCHEDLVVGAAGLMMGDSGSPVWTQTVFGKVALGLENGFNEPDTFEYAMVEIQSIQSILNVKVATG